MKTLNGVFGESDNIEIVLQHSSLSELSIKDVSDCLMRRKAKMFHMIKDVTPKPDFTLNVHFQ